MENFKYKIGDFVIPIVQNDYEHATKMVITARVTEESAQNIDYYYICSHYKLGDYVRQRISESELAPWSKS